MPQVRSREFILLSNKIHYIIQHLQHFVSYFWDAWGIQWIKKYSPFWTVHQKVTNRTSLFIYPPFRHNWATSSLPLIFWGKAFLTSQPHTKDLNNFLNQLMQWKWKNMTNRITLILTSSKNSIYPFVSVCVCSFFFNATTSVASFLVVSSNIFFTSYFLGAILFYAVLMQNNNN